MEKNFASKPSKGSSPVQNARKLEDFASLPFLNTRRSVKAKRKDTARHYAKIAKEWQRPIVLIRPMQPILIPALSREIKFA